jgi:hypothetical protein
MGMTLIHHLNNSFKWFLNCPGCKRPYKSQPKKLVDMRKNLIEGKKIEIIPNPNAINDSNETVDVRCNHCNFVVTYVLDLTKPIRNIN